MLALVDSSVTTAIGARTGTGCFLRDTGLSRQGALLCLLATLGGRFPRRPWLRLLSRTGALCTRQTDGIARLSSFSVSGHTLRTMP
jgi:hypothetical protein